MIIAPTQLATPRHISHFHFRPWNWPAPVLERIRASVDFKTLPVLILTTESAQELKNRARMAGATGWIVKPFDDGKLVSAIRRISAV